MANQQWHHLYNDRRWKGTAKGKWMDGLRGAILLRDMWTCQKTGVLCTGMHPAWNSPVVDHIIKHEGDEELFFDPDNCQTVTKQYHDSDKQSQERGNKLHWELDSDGWPVYDAVVK